MAYGIFQQFVRELRREWTRGLAEVAPVSTTFAPAMPKASTFYAGEAKALGKHIFVNLQHHSKPWAVGQFTVNVVVSNTMGAPARWLTRDNELSTASEGSYRLGMLLYGKDKWWCLRPTNDTHGLTWRANAYGDTSAVLREAIDDVTKDVRAILRRIHEAA